MARTSRSNSIRRPRSAIARLSSSASSAGSALAMPPEQLPPGSSRAGSNSSSSLNRTRGPDGRPPSTRAGGLCSAIGGGCGGCGGDGGCGGGEGGHTGDKGRVGTPTVKGKARRRRVGAAAAPAEASFSAALRCPAGGPAALPWCAGHCAPSWTDVVSTRPTSPSSLYCRKAVSLDRVPFKCREGCCGCGCRGCCCCGGCGGDADGSRCCCSCRRCCSSRSRYSCCSCRQCSCSSDSRDVNPPCCRGGGRRG